jgi:hypothetical protein
MAQSKKLKVHCADLMGLREDGLVGIFYIGIDSLTEPDRWQLQPYRLYDTGGDWTVIGRKVTRRIARMVVAFLLENATPYAVEEVQTHDGGLLYRATKAQGGFDVPND